MSFLWYCFICLFLFVGLGKELAHARHFNRKNQVKLVANKKIKVDPSGKGNFSTIQSAIDSVPSNNKNWVQINVNAGTYREKLTIPVDKPYIIIEGQGKLNTFVEWDDHDNILQCPTFSAWANNLVIRFISFRNSYNSPKNSNPMTPAVATLISGNESYFLNVGFYGVQDTLWDNKGTHYYQNCTIQGAVDFIFGAGQSIFNGCDINVVDAEPGEDLAGFITAQGRTNPNDSNGFVFKNCSINVNGRTYLGRPWRPYARVLFYNSTMPNIIEPEGWAPWNHTLEGDESTFAESRNNGPGADTSKRVSWVKKLDSVTVRKMTSTRFVDNNGWLTRTVLIQSAKGTGRMF
ncbi:hypothetical protein VNO77_42255 [Canavalia gladiata]|uniref:Pectinesterase n=1 Tax=Canavalia gladiata TaxID=3824 RepID=A0AAN9K260_CANGL